MHNGKQNVETEANVWPFLGHVILSMPKLKQKISVRRVHLIRKRKHCFQHIKVMIWGKSQVNSQLISGHHVSCILHAVAGRYPGLH